MESPFGPRWTKARSLVLPRGNYNLDYPFRVVPLIRGVGIKVFFDVLPEEKCTFTNLRIIQPVLARHDAWSHRCREKYDSRSHGRDKCCPRIFDAPNGMVGRIRDRVCLSFSFSLFLADFIDLSSPLVGGILSRPQDRWPNIFSHHFWADFPYFLPCLVAATFTCLSFIIGVFFLEEVCCFLLFEESYVVTATSRR